MLLAAAVGAHGAQPARWRTYADPQSRFTFEFPEDLGTPGPGTNDGFGDRVAAVRFSGLTGLGGEAVLTRGPVVLDIQALGGLYDPIALEAVPDAMRRQIEASRPAVTPASLCSLLGEADHLSGATALTEPVRTAARQLDRMRNLDPRIIRCDVDGAVITFHKEATFESGTVTARQHIFGAIRFLPAPHSAFHIVRATNTRPSAEELDRLTRMVRSFRGNGLRPTAYGLGLRA